MNLNRYDRQMKLAEIDTEGQLRLSRSRVLVIGAGGLGCPALLYLAGAGIGTIGIVDADRVSMENLPRQILHPEKNIGINKAESAREMLRKINSEIKINSYPLLLTEENAEELFSVYDFIIDAVDNFETKYIINDTCVKLKKPFCHAGVIQFHGQLMTYVPGKGPCLRCIFDVEPEPGSVPKCAQVGVLGPVCGVIGNLEAIEAIKYLTGAGQLLTGKMLIFDALTMKARIAVFSSPSPKCKVCSKETY